MQQRTATIAEGRHLRACEVDLAVHGHEQLDGFEPWIVSQDEIAVVHQFIGEVLDGVAEDLQGATGGGIDAAPAVGAGR